MYPAFIFYTEKAGAKVFRLQMFHVEQKLTLRSPLKFSAPEARIIYKNKTGAPSR